MRKNDYHGAYGANLASCFRIAPSGSLVLDWPQKSTFAITRIRSRVGLSDFTEPVPSQPAIFMAVAIQPVVAGDFERRYDGKVIPVSSIPAFGTSVLDLQASPRAWIRTGFDYLHFYIPRAGLNDIARDHGMAPIENYRHVAGEWDIAMAQFAKTILPLVRRNSSASSLALDQLSLLLGAHLLGRYAGIEKLPDPPASGLAPWQMRRAEEILREHLDGNIRVQQVAQECGLSVSQFARAFKTSFGTSTIQWVIGQRIKLAQQLLLESRLSLSDIAVQSGFADQSALTRTFLHRVGTSPGRWRREKRGMVSTVSDAALEDAPLVRMRHDGLFEDL